MEEGFDGTFFGFVGGGELCFGAILVEGRAASCAFLVGGGASFGGTISWEVALTFGGSVF